uniref:Uncharacterized protein n=1 Tax=Arundo donax TaxID=35708 RepID=A0A0A9AX72_ARUDO
MPCVICDYVKSWTSRLLYPVIVVLEYF